eukprot:5993898-Amphidinium_carterae.4
MGHPHPAQFVRILRAAQASSKVLAIASNLQCSVCAQTHTPVPHHRSASLPSSCLGFNQVIGVDLFFVQGIDGEGQGFWGSPQTDQGKEFVGAEFSERLGTDGTVHEVTPTDAPWQNGRTERHGGTVKLMLTRARISQPPQDKELEEILCATVHAKNAYSLVGGYSPHQRKFGVDEWREVDIADMSALEAGDETLLRSMHICKAAQESFHFVDASARVRRSILSGPRPVRQYQHGDQVCFWRREGDVQAFRHEHAHTHWHGPALIVGHHRSKVWLSCRGHLWLCAPEQVRDATREEQLAHDRVTQDLLEAARELRVEGTGYQDLSEIQSSEPATSAWLARPFDANKDQPGDMQEGLSDTREEVIPEPPNTDVEENISRSRTRRSGAQRVHRSRSRSRGESLLCLDTTSDDQALLPVAGIFGQLQRQTYDKGPKAEVRKRKEVNIVPTGSR